MRAHLAIKLQIVPHAADNSSFNNLNSYANKANGQPSR